MHWFNVKFFFFYIPRIFWNLVFQEPFKNSNCLYFLDSSVPLIPYVKHKGRNNDSAVGGMNELVDERYFELATTLWGIHYIDLKALANKNVCIKDFQCNIVVAKNKMGKKTRISIQLCIVKQMWYIYIMKHYVVVLDISWVLSHILSGHILLRLLL